MKMLVEQEEIYFEIEHWIYKSLGMRGIAIMFGETDKDPPDLQIDLMYPVTDHEHLMVRWFPWLDYEHLETRETATQEIDVVVLQVSVNELGKSYIAAENYFADGLPDPEPPEWWGMAAGIIDDLDKL